MRVESEQTVPSDVLSTVQTIFLEGGPLIAGGNPVVKNSQFPERAGRMPRPATFGKGEMRFQQVKP